MKVYIKATGNLANLRADHITAYKDGHPTIISWDVGPYLVGPLADDGKRKYSGALGPVKIGTADAKGTLEAVTKYDIYVVTFVDGGTGRPLPYAPVPSVTSIMFEEDDGRFGIIPAGRCLASLFK